MSSENRVKEGELIKYRNMLHGWKKYYFRLERSYLHYFEGKYNSEPKATITRGEISQLTFSKDTQSYGFDIHQTSGDIWYLKASSREERMDWMRALQPNAYFVDPCKKNEPVVEQSHPSAPLEEQPNQCSHVEPSHPRLYPQLPTTCTSNASDTCMHQGHTPGPPNTPPPAYDEIYT